MFVKTIKPDLLIGERCWNLGAVVEVDDTRGKTLIKDEVAVPDDGPASEPDRPADAAQGKTPKK